MREFPAISHLLASPVCDLCGHALTQSDLGGICSRLSPRQLQMEVGLHLDSLMYRGVL